MDPRGVAALDQPAATGSRSGLRLSSAGTGTGGGDLAALTAPEPVSGLGTVGVTWKRGTRHLKYDDDIEDVNSEDMDEEMGDDEELGADI